MQKLRYASSFWVNRMLLYGSSSQFVLDLVDRASLQVRIKLTGGFVAVLSSLPLMFVMHILLKYQRHSGHCWKWLVLIKNSGFEWFITHCVSLEKAETISGSQSAGSTSINSSRRWYLVAVGYSALIPSICVTCLEALLLETVRYLPRGCFVFPEPKDFVFVWSVSVTDLKMEQLVSLLIETSIQQSLGTQKTKNIYLVQTLYQYCCLVFIFGNHEIHDFSKVRFSFLTGAALLHLSGKEQQIGKHELWKQGGLWPFCSRLERPWYGHAVSVIGTRLGASSSF